MTRAGATVRHRAASTAVAFRALARNGPLRLVLLAFLLFAAVELGTWVAILLYAYDALDPAAVGAVALVQLLPAGLVAPFAASLADRYDRRRVLAGGYAAQALALAATAAGILAGATPPLVIVTGTLAVMAMTITRPTQGSLLPALGRTPTEVAGANGIAGAVEGIGMLVGPLATAAILLVGGTGHVFLAGATAAGVAMLLVAGAGRGTAATATATTSAGHRHEQRVTQDGSHHDHAHPADAAHESVLAGLRVVLANADTRLLVGLLSLRKLVSGALDVLFVLLALEVLGTGGSGAGILSAALGLGTLIGGAAAFTLVGRPRLAPAMALAAALLGVGVMASGGPLPALLVPVLIGLAGVGYAGMDVAGRTILQRATPDAVLGRVLGGLEGSGLVAVAIGSVLVGPVVALTSVQVAVVTTGLVLLVGILAGWRGLRRIDATVRVPLREIRVLGAVPAFAPLPPPQLERVAGRARWQTAEPHEVIIREGDEGDRYYVVESGRVRVTREGAELRVMGEGEGFGEIALLRNVARTASVTAVDACVLLTLDRHDFLEVVTGHDQVHEAVERTAVERGATVS
ncbi:MAG TPA: MFS transporter [Candidatus Limnocylindrales bacterium]|nr:MFS transporter [Candidatus Limnocylindrales bacterium]